MQTSHRHHLILGLLAIALLAQLSFSQTITSKATGGRWSDPATWVGGTLPNLNTDVVIAGPVLYGNGDGSCKNLTVNAGASLYNYSCYACYEHILTVFGNVTNNGTMRNDGSYALVLKIKGNITNNGIWTFRRTELSGTAQSLSSVGINRFASPIIVDTNYRPVLTATSGLVFSSYLDLGKSSLDMKGFAISFIGESANIGNGTINNAGDVSGRWADDGAGIWYKYPVLSNVTYNGTINIRGRIQIDWGVVMTGNITVTDTVENSSGYAHPEKKLTITGNLVNNGIIRNGQGAGFALNVSGNITNNGKWVHNRTELSGKPDQILTLGAGKFFETAFAVTDSVGSIVAGSDLAFMQSFYLKNSPLDMKSFSLTLRGAAANISSGQVLNTKDIVGQPSTDSYSYWYSNPVLSNVTYSGTINIHGRVQIDWGVVMAGTVTVTDTVENSSGYAHPEKKLMINGNLVNNGIIRNGQGAGFALNVSGNITNNGKWVHNRTELSGKPDQILTLGANKFFETAFTVTDSVGSIVAGSNLAFMQSFYLKNSALDMKSFSLTLQGAAANINTGQVLNTKDVIGQPSTDSYSYWYSNPVLSNVTYSGTPNIRGRVQIDWGVVMAGTVTVTDTVENSSGYAHPEKKLMINGNLVNNGIIRNGQGAGFALNVSGNITNNGKWVHNRTELSGISDQTLVLGTGKLFEASFSVTDSLGMIVAGSNLAFSGGFDLRKCVFDMKKYGVTLQGSGANIYNGIVINTRDITGKQVVDIYGTPIIDNITYNGTISLRGILRVNSGTLQGDVTVIDTIQNSSGYAHPEKFLKIAGNITNNGLVQDGGSAGFVLDVTGNITATKAFVNKRIQLAGTGNRTINDKVSTAQYYSTGEKVVLYGENYLPNLSIASTSKCLLASGSSIYMPNNSIDETLDNWSVIAITRKPSSSQVNSYFKARIAVTSTSTFDSIKVSTFGHQVPPTFSNAVRTWWRLDKTPKTGSSSVSTLTMYYRDDELGQNVEANLQVYYSADTGKTWRQLSTSQNLTRNTDQNFVSLTDAPSAGDFVLSSSPDPLYVRPTVIVSVTGRTQIRVGPPNRYTVDYVNNSDVPTGDMLISLRTQGGVHISQVEPSMPAGVKLQVIPIDSMWYGGQKDSCLLWVASMAPREERKFDVVLSAEVAGSSNLNSTADVKIVPLLICAAWWVGEALVAGYVGDVVMNVTENIWRPVAPCETVGGAFKSIIYDSFHKANSDWFGRERPAKAVMDAAKDGIREKIGLTIPGEQLLDAANATMTGAQKYLNGEFKVKDCSGNQKSLGGDVAQNNKTLQKVTSWDPNEKDGPTGYGTEGFMSTAGKMTYQILFENKKEATAPAWKIVIVDTLQADFDPTTVEFGRTSHDGPQYNWVMSRNDNIVQWSIEGIELPPNVTPPQGEGYVSFSVQPKSTIASGTKLKNHATITFDVNKPLATNEVVNTIDFTPPTTVMKSLAVTTNRSPVAVRWQSSDGTTGAGVKSVTVFASKDGGPYYTVGTSALDSILVPVTNGNYTFYGLAVDNVGNVEVLRPAISQIKVASVVSVESQEVPLEFSLDQNYPNPFNPTTTIAYSLSAKVRASLKVYDVLGRVIADLFDEEQTAGKHTVIWDAGKVSSGVYFYRLTAGDFVQTRKLMLLK